MFCRVGEQKNATRTFSQAARRQAFIPLLRSASGHDRSLADILYIPHHRRFNGSAFAVHRLQLYEDGRKIALYANTLPGSFFLREEVV